MAENIKRAASPDSPTRCQATVKTQGQCTLEAVPGSPYCSVHGGSKIALAQRTAELNNYRLTNYKVRVGELANSEKVKSLRDEIGILRMLVEERLNSCRTDLDLIIHSQPLAELIMKVDKLVNSCHSLETKMSLMLDRSAVIQLSSVIVDIIGQYVTDPDELIDIATKIGAAVESAANEQPS